MIRDGRIRSLIVVATASLVCGTYLAGCAATSGTVGSDEESAADALVIGKLRLVKNNRDIKLGESIFANTAILYFYGADGRQETLGEVGHNGEFSWVLEPGSYRVSSIGFNHNGQRVEPGTDFSFDVSPDHAATYVGTVTPEATFDSGYLGVDARVDRHTVHDDCNMDCGRMLTRLGLPQDVATVALLHREERVADTSR